MPPLEMVLMKIKVLKHSLQLCLFIYAWSYLFQSVLKPTSLLPQPSLSPGTEAFTTIPNTYFDMLLDPIFENSRV